MIPTVAQLRVSSCYVLQQARLIERHKPLTQHYLVDDPYLRIDKNFETIALCIQKQASLIDQQTPSKKLVSPVLGREKQIQNFFEIRSECNALSSIAATT